MTYLGYDAFEDEEEAVDRTCLCGHLESSHSDEIGCEVFINEMVGDCMCEKFRATP